ncbi:hypothetical protein MJ1_0473 [Nanobdella aerobiophila]|uniref:Uncharacterized protein n=1 Tax=Nanobdella aerobiophila TaxID=2586965 RepID=A0A915SKY2_9ARCH|nr:hypothetical protein [Nanobdella aerobiophila]BBL45631.1 hypothetical protein MJ1_0473 [Nanobdella aerobiophila]
MPLIIPSPEYSKRRRILELDRKIKKAEKNKNGKLNVILKKTININNPTESIRLISMLNKLEQEGYFDELYIVRYNQLLDSIDLLKNTEKELPKEDLIKLYNIVSKLIDIVNKLKK